MTEPRKKDIFFQPCALIDSQKDLLGTWSGRKVKVCITVFVLISPWCEFPCLSQLLNDRINIFSPVPVTAQFDQNAKETLLPFLRIATHGIK